MSLEQRLAYLERRVNELLWRHGSPFAYARSTLPPDDSGAVQKVQAELDPLSVRDGIPVLYNYGFFAVPPVGCDMHIAYLDGKRHHAVVIASNHQQHRFTGAAIGDAGLYAQGKKVHLNEGGIDVIGDIHQQGNQTITGDLHVTGEVIARSSGAFVTLSQHHHSNTGPPIGGS